jgi:hypothetical protein
MSTIKTLAIAAAVLAGASTLAMAQDTGGGMGSGNGGMAPIGATPQQPGTRSGSSANDQKTNKQPAGENYKMQGGSTQGGSSMQGGSMDSGK